MTPLNAARPSKGVDVTSGGTGGEEPTRVSKQKREKRKGDRPESKSRFRLNKPSPGSIVTDATSASSDKLALRALKTLLIGPETSTTEKEGFTRRRGPRPGNVGRERHHNLAQGRPVDDGETFGSDRSRLNRHVIGVEK